MTSHTIIKRLDAWLELHRPVYHRQLNRPASAQTIARLEKHVGQPLPAAFKALLQWKNGQRLDCYEALQFNRSFMSVADILEARSDLNALLDAGDFERANWWSKQWVPFLDNGGGDLLVIDLEGSFGGKPGQILEFWHDETWRTIVHASFEAWLGAFVASLEAGLWKVIAAADDDDADEFEPRSDRALAQFTAKLNPGYPLRKLAGGRAKATTKPAAKSRSVPWRQVKTVTRDQLTRASPGTAFTTVDDDLDVTCLYVKSRDDFWVFASGDDWQAARAKLMNTLQKFGTKKRVAKRAADTWQFSDERLAKVLAMSSQLHTTPDLDADLDD